MQATLQTRCAGSSSFRAASLRSSTTTVAVLRSAVRPSPASSSSSRRFIPTLAPSTHRPMPSSVDGGVVIGARVSGFGREKREKELNETAIWLACDFFSSVYSPRNSRGKRSRLRSLTIRTTTGRHPPWAVWPGTAGARSYCGRRGADFR